MIDKTSFWEEYDVQVFGSVIARKYCIFTMNCALNKFWGENSCRDNEVVLIKNEEDRMVLNKK